MPPPIYVSYYTPQYADVIRGLKASQDRFGLEYVHRAIPCLGSWHANVNIKPMIIRETMHEFPEQMVVYVDADAEFVKQPVLLDIMAERDGYGFAIAAHTFRGREILSGTLAFWPNNESATLLNDWEYRCASNPKVWDQRNLSDALNSGVSTVTHRVYPLPEAYCHIFDHHDTVIEEAVIVHHQASRTKRRAVGMYKDGPR